MSALEFTLISSGTRAASANARSHVAIPSYNRPEMLRKLIDRLNAGHDSNRPLIDVFDDGSDTICTFLRDVPNVRWFRRERNGGKRRYWQLWQALLQALRDSTADRYLVLPDDAEIDAAFLPRALQQFDAIDDPRLAFLNPLLDAQRIGAACWTNYRPHVCRFGNEDYYQTQWNDGCLISGRAGFDALDWTVHPIDAARWERAPQLSSGVGQQISRRLHTAGRNLYQVTSSLVRHGSHASQMHSRERVRSPLLTTSPLGERKFLDRLSAETTVAGMATIPSRVEALERSVDSIAPQVDRLHVYLNGFDDVPKCLHRDNITVHTSQQAAGDLGDAGKFYAADDADGFFFGCDDDIVYPADYVARMIDAVETFDRQVCVSLHGANVSPPLESYYRNRRTFHCRSRAPRDVPADVLGTGLLAFHTGTIRFSARDCLQPNMADLWFALAAQRQRVGLVVLAHPADCITLIDVPYTIFETQRRDDQLQTDLVNAHGWRRWAASAARFRRPNHE